MELRIAMAAKTENKVKTVPRPTMSTLALTAQEIAERTSRPLEDVQAVISSLSNEFKPPKPTVDRNRVQQVAFSGFHLDAILTTLVGLTPEAIAKRIGSVGIAKVTEYLTTHHTPNELGRYGRAALHGAILTFQAQSKQRRAQ